MELIHSIDGIVWEADARTLQFLFVSRQAERLFGYPISDWLVDPDFWRNHLHPDDREATARACIDATAKGLPHELEYRMVARDGHEVWLRDIVTFHEEDGQPARLRGVMIDITNSRLQAQALDRMTSLYAALSHVSEVALHAREESVLFKRVCKALVEFGGLKMAWIGSNDPVTAAVTIVAHDGDVSGYLREIVVRSDDTPEGRGPVGVAIREGRPCVLGDFLSTPGTQPWRSNAARSGFRSVGAFPIRRAGRVWGALAGYAAGLDFFGPQETELLERAAGHLGFALDHQDGASRRKQAETALRQSETRFRLMFEHTADALMIMDCTTGRFTDCNHAALQMLGLSSKSEVLGLTPAGISPEQQPDGVNSGAYAALLIATALERGSHRFEWMLRGARGDFPVEVLLTPIHVDDDRIIIGTLRDITQRRRDERTQAALHRISEAAHSSASLAELFARIHQIVGELLPARNFFVALHDDRSDELSFPYFVDEIDRPTGPMRLDDGTLSGEVIRSGKALLLDPEARRRRVESGQRTVGAESVDWLGVPLKSRSRTFGALVVQTYSGDVRYSAGDMELLEFVSAQVAAAIVRKQAEEALRASEIRFRLLFEQNQAGVYRTRPDGRILECNDAFARLLGYGSKNEVMALDAHALYFEGTRGSSRDAFLDGLRTRGAATNAVVCLRRKDGTEFWGMESAALIGDEDGQQEVIQGTVIDFTDRRRMEEELRRSESRLEEAQRLGHLGSWNWDLASGTLRWSDELCRIYGVDPADHAPGFEDFLARVHADDRQAVRERVAGALADGKHFQHELRIVRPDGEVRALFDQAEVLVDEQGRVSAIAGACLDVTSRKLDERFEQDRRAILEQVVQGKPLPEIFQQIATMVEAQTPRTRCSVLLLQDGGLRAGFGPHLHCGFSQALEGLSVTDERADGDGAATPVRVVVAEDIANDPRWECHRDIALSQGLRACWSMPVPSSNGGVLGSLAVFCEEPARPTSREADHMATAAQLMAVAIEHRLLTERLEHQAHHDALTGLPNRMLFKDRLRQALAQSHRRQQQVAVLYMDLDRFKNVNDTFGHSAGDALLKQAAERLNACVRKSDTLARLGGDEFIVLVAELTDPQSVMRVASELIETLRQPFHIEGHEAFLSVSVGISIFPDDGQDGEMLIANADVAMYRAKEKGRDNFQWFAAEMNVMARERMDLETQLRHALRLGQLRLNYQPQCGANGEIQAFEALMRWQHPTLGAIPPSRFIPLAEDSGMIVPMGEWALREACAQLVTWRRSHSSLRIAVNVSAVQFRRADWVDTVVRVLAETGLEPSALELEITESLILQSVTETSANLLELRALGVGIAIDDFGTGYSSLSYLHKLPVTTLKIDQSFVRDIGTSSRDNPQDAPIIRTIIALARNFGLGVVAEGVETEVQRDLLVRLGCESLQGYLLHRPLPVEQADTLLASMAEQTRA